MPPFAKDGSLVCEPWLAFVRRLPCAFCGVSESQAHHFPPKGRGVTDDSKTCPACQAIAVERTRGLFMEEANDFEWAAFCAARKRHRESRVFVDIPA